MATSTAYKKIAWEDRFNRPDVPAFRAALKANDRSLFDRLCKHIGELERVSQGVAWYGESWRWVVEFRAAREPQPFAVIVPSPEDLQLAMPTSRQFAAEISTRRLKRAVRDGLELAGEPFDTRWAVWSVNSASLLAELMHLLEDKRRFLVRSAG
jgi:hypothetical protein